MLFKTLITTLSFSSLVSVTAMAQDRVGEIYDTGKIERRVEARNYNFFSFGPNSLDNLGAEGAGQSITYGHIWETTPHAAITAALDGGFNFGDVKASVVSGTLGANFYLTPTATSPYLGFGFGYGAAATEAEGIENVGGWAGKITAGVALFRTSSAQMHITGQYIQIFADNEEGQPSHGTISLGVAF